MRYWSIESNQWGEGRGALEIRSWDKQTGIKIVRITITITSITVTLTSMTINMRKEALEITITKTIH